MYVFPSPAAVPCRASIWPFESAVFETLGQPDGSICETPTESPANNSRLTSSVSNGTLWVFWRVCTVGWGLFWIFNKINNATKSEVIKTLCFCFVPSELFLVGGWDILWERCFVSPPGRGSALRAEKLEGFFLVAGHRSFCNTELSLRNDVPLISMTWSYKKDFSEGPERQKPSHFWCEYFLDKCLFWVHLFTIC